MYKLAWSYFWLKLTNLQTTWNRWSPHNYSLFCIQNKEIGICPRTWKVRKVGEEVAEGGGRERGRRGGGEKLAFFQKFQHLRWPVVAGATQEVEGIQKIALHPINHLKTVHLIHVFLKGQENVSHRYLSHFLPCSHQLWSIQSSLCQAINVTKVTMLLQQ